MSNNTDINKPKFEQDEDYEDGHEILEDKNDEDDDLLRMVYGRRKTNQINKKDKKTN